MITTIIIDAIKDRKFNFKYIMKSDKWLRILAEELIKNSSFINTKMFLKKKDKWCKIQQGIHLF